MKSAPFAIVLVLGLVWAAQAQQQTKPAPEIQTAPQIRTQPEQVTILPEMRSAPGAYIWIAPEMKTPQGQVKISPEVIEKLKKKLSQQVAGLTFAHVCYSMNSFVFARENGGDAMRLVDHTTCTPSARFSVKNAPAKSR